MKVINHGAGKIELPCTCAQARPIELRYKSDGAKDNKPSLAVVMEYASGAQVVGQMSLATLEDCLNQLGYTLSHLEAKEGRG